MCGLVTESSPDVPSATPVVHADSIVFTGGSFLHFRYFAISLTLLQSRYLGDVLLV
jgi:hypothetical protein